MNAFVRALLPALALAPSLASCAVGVSPVSGARRAYAYTWEQEIRLGREADREIVEQLGVVEDSALDAYVRRVGEAVLAESHLRREGALREYRETPFTFRVLDTEGVNAFALPGGYVYVTRGLLAHLDSEAQLAVVLGHEIAHVAARHSSREALKTGLVTLGVRGAGVLGEEAGGVAGVLADLGGMSAALLVLRHSRDDERESDALGVEYAARAGYDAAEGAAFFAALRRMGRREGPFPSFLSTHPDPGRREETVRELAARHAPSGASPRVERDAYLAAVEGLALGGDPRQGFVDGDVFYHPAGRFRFPLPAGWEMSREGREVQLAPERGTAYVLFTAATRHPSAAAAAAAFVAENELDDVSASTPALRGLRARRVDATARDDEGTYRLAALWVEHGGAVRGFLGLAAPEDARALSGALGVMAGGLEPLDDPERLSVRPAYLEVVRLDGASTLEAAVGDRILPDGMDLEDLAILNGVEVDAELPAGTRLKLPR